MSRNIELLFCAIESTHALQPTLPLRPSFFVCFSFLFLTLHCRSRSENRSLSLSCFSSILQHKQQIEKERCLVIQIPLHDDGDDDDAPSLSCLFSFKANEKKKNKVVAAQPRKKRNFKTLRILFAQKVTQKKKRKK